jgi:hypothetical protein
MANGNKPDTKVTTLEIPYKVLVLRNDPEFEIKKRRDPFYEFTGRTFFGNTARKGAYAPDDN